MLLRGIIDNISCTRVDNLSAGVSEFFLNNQNVKQLKAVKYDERLKMKRDARTQGKRLLSVGHLSLFLGVLRTLWLYFNLEIQPDELNINLGF